MMKYPDVLLKIKKFIETHQLFSRGETIVVGVSGGADSVALIHILHALQYELGIHLHAAHYNHHLRRGADTDQRFVEHLARDLHIPLTVGRWKNPSLSAKGSLEDRARQQRMIFFVRLAGKLKVRTIALAHTQNDLAETVLMHILRGSGLQGMRGILPLKEMKGRRFVRPLLGTTRKEVEAYLKKHKMTFRTDPTNRQTKFFRNKIRLQLLPLLRSEYNKNMDELLANLADTMTVDYACLETQARRLFQKIVRDSRNPVGLDIDLKKLTKEHPAMQRMIVRLAIEELKGDTNRLSLAHARDIVDLIHRRPLSSIVDLPDGIYLQKKEERLILRKNNSLHNHY